jgi:hypothetical protein
LKRLSRKIELRVAVITAIALLIAQFGAQAHAYTHLRLGSDTTTDQLDSHGKLCLDCLAFAPLQAKAGGHSLPVVFAPQGVEIAPASAVVSLTERVLTPAFRSRAPPALS